MKSNYPLFFYLRIYDYNFKNILIHSPFVCLSVRFAVSTRGPWIMKVCVKWTCIFKKKLKLKLQFHFKTLCQWSLIMTTIFSLDHITSFLAPLNFLRLLLNTTDLNMWVHIMRNRNDSRDKCRPCKPIYDNWIFLDTLKLLWMMHNIVVTNLCI